MYCALRFGSTGVIGVPRMRYGSLVAVNFGALLSGVRWPPVGSKLFTSSESSPPNERMLISIGIDSKKRPKLTYTLLRPLFAGSQMAPTRGAQLFFRSIFVAPRRSPTFCSSQRTPALRVKLLRIFHESCP